MSKQYEVWKPTKNLRFRKEYSDDRIVVILQQEWRRGYGRDERDSEWRDVPVEEA